MATFKAIVFQTGRHLNQYNDIRFEDSSKTSK